MLLRDGTTPLGINDDSSSFVAAREREFNEINAAEPGVCDEPTHRTRSANRHAMYTAIGSRFGSRRPPPPPPPRAEYFRFRFWESDDDDDVSGVRGVDRIGEYRKEDDRDMDCGIEVEENDSGTYVDYLYGRMTKERLDWM